MPVPLPEASRSRSREPDTLAEPEPGRLILAPLHGEGVHLTGQSPRARRPALDLDTLAEPVNLAEPGRRSKCRNLSRTCRK